ncbi:MAG: hypothetical protein ACJ76V_01035 [Thermoleophilaceae bacterium]
MARKLLAAVLASLAFAVPAMAQSGAPAAPWDGTNPFNCTLQQAGGGVDIPDPSADPLCVEYDKTHQTVLDGGIADFLSKEPQRVALALPKCFYYQRDHWKAQLATGLPAPLDTALYQWDGSYFFDKLHGTGGVYVENFRALGQSFDPTVLPGFPAELKPYFGLGRGGVQSLQGIPADPSCAGKEGAPTPNSAGFVGSQGGFDDIPLVSCGKYKGRVSTKVGRINLHDTRRRVIRRLGAPDSERNKVARWCIAYGGDIRVGLPSRSSGTRTPFILTTSRALSTHGVHIGFSEAQLRLRLHHEETFSKRAGTTVVSTTSRRYRFLIGFRNHRARWLAVADRGLSKSGLATWLARAT